MRFIKIMLIAFGSLSILGCGKEWLRDRSQDYQKCEASPILKVPAGLNAEPFSKEYEIPKE